MEASFGRTPHPDTLGYQAALDAGFAIVESGSSVAALPYFERAVALRPTSIALTQQGKCLRDLGRTSEALVAYRRAVTASGGGGHARVSLVALLIDMEEFVEGVDLAGKAFADEPTNPAVLNVYASSIEGLATRSQGGQAMSPEQRAPLLKRVRELRTQAHELQPEAREEWLQRRRDRTFPIHSVTPARISPAVPVEQARTAPVAWRELTPTTDTTSAGRDKPQARASTEDVALDAPITPSPPAQHAANPARQDQEAGLLLRWCRRVFRRSPAP